MERGRGGGESGELVNRISDGWKREECKMGGEREGEGELGVGNVYNIFMEQDRDGTVL